MDQFEVLREMFTRVKTLDAAIAHLKIERERLRKLINNANSRARHRERRREYSKWYYQTHSEQCKDKNNVWRKLHPESDREYHRRRYATSPEFRAKVAAESKKRAAVRYTNVTDLYIRNIFVLPKNVPQELLVGLRVQILINREIKRQKNELQNQ